MLEFSFKVLSSSPVCSEIKSQDARKLLYRTIDLEKLSFNASVTVYCLGREPLRIKLRIKRVKYMGKYRRNFPTHLLNKE